MKYIPNLEYKKNLYLDLFLPDEECFSLIVHFHGGGLVEGDKGDTYEYVKHLVSKGYGVATANYSLLPDHKYPSFILDAADAVKYVKDFVPKYGKIKDLMISGQSAGAYLTLMLCFDHHYLKDVGINPSEISLFISDSAQPTTHFNIMKYERNLPSDLVMIDETAPMYYVNKNTSNSWLLLITYTNDIPHRMEQNKELYQKIKECNKDAPVTLKILDGYHCQGSSELDSTGEYPVIKELEKVVRKI